MSLNQDKEERDSLSVYYIILLKEATITLFSNLKATSKIRIHNYIHNNKASHLE